MGVYWGRLALPSSGELVGRVQLQASDQIASLEVGLAYPSVAVTASGVVWVGFSFSGAQQYPGVWGCGASPGSLGFWASRMVSGHCHLAGS